MKRDVILWTGLAAGPLAWLLNLQISFVLAPWLCVDHWMAVSYGVSIAAAAIAASSAALSWREWRTIAQQNSELAVSPAGAMAAGGAILSAFACLIIVAQMIPNLILARCS